MQKTSHSTLYFFEFKGQNASASAAEPVPILVRKRKGAKSMVLRYRPQTHALALTLPHHVSIARGLRFVEDKRQWVMQQLEKKPQTVPFDDGQIIPVLGESLRLKHVGGRGVISRREGDVLVPGDREFMTRRVREWLMNEARLAIGDLAQGKARLIRRRIARITLRDMHSLWGSCTQDGKLSFSWRLALAPPEVLDYLVSHEVAHLAELNHGPAFWRVVETLCPGWRKARAWLKRHGDTLYGYG